MDYARTIGSGNYFLIWAASWQNQQNGCAPSEDSESSLSAWRKLGSLATYWAHSEDWSEWADAQADLSLRWAHMPFRWFVTMWLISSVFSISSLIKAVSHNTSRVFCKLRDAYVTRAVINGGHEEYVEAAMFLLSWRTFATRHNGTGLNEAILHFVVLFRFIPKCCSDQYFA